MKKYNPEGKFTKFETREDWEKIELNNDSTHMIACCDCGLVHKMAVSYRDGKIGLAFERDELETQHRRNFFNPDQTRKNDAPIVNRYHREVWGLNKRIEDLLDELIIEKSRTNLKEI